MWQADTFDLPTIDRELGWAESLGMNTMRVFLHNLLWQQDSAGFLKRMDQFLAVAEKHHIPDYVLRACSIPSGIPIHTLGKC